MQVSEKHATIEDVKLNLIDEKQKINAFTEELKTLEAKESKTKEDYERIVSLYKMIAVEEKLIKSTKKHLKHTKRIKYVKRDAIKKIIEAWIITVPAAATLAAILFFMIKGIMV